MMEFRKPGDKLMLHYRIATPMFLGGASQEVDDKHFRNASFRGALRFWWRALNWARFYRDARKNKQQALKDMHAEEKRLFGMAADNSADSRQSRVQVRSRMENAHKTDAGSSKFDALSYFLGQGLWSHQKKLLRDCISSGDIEITLTIAPSQDAAQKRKDVESIAQAAIALGLFGGLGSRSRKGLGSLSLESLQINDETPERFDSVEAVRKFVAKLPKDTPDNETPLSAFTEGHEVQIIEKQGNAFLTNPVSALEHVSDTMQSYRSNKKSFGNDAKIMRDELDGTKSSALPKRSVFGLPHNYFFRKRGGVGVNVQGNRRRASPLFIHVHHVCDSDGSERYVIVQTLLPAIFLPDELKINIKPGNRDGHAIGADHVDYGVIQKYMREFK